MQFSRIFLMFIMVLCFYSCAAYRKVYTTDEGAFNTPSNAYALKNPQNNVARVYVLGSGGASLTLEYNPEIIRGHPRRSLAHDVIASFLYPNTIFYFDTLPNTPIALTTRGPRVNYIIFTPKASKIYCVINRNSVLQLVDYEACMRKYKDLKSNIRVSRRHQRAWRELFLRKNPSKLDGEVFWLSYMMERDDLQ